MMNLRMNDVDTERGYLRVNQGKGGKDRVVPLGRIASHYVETYQTGVRKMQLRSEEDPGWLFLSHRGKKLTTTTLRTIVNEARARAKIEKNITCHTFRRTCATEMIKNNANIMHVKEILGHEDITSTQVYAKLTINDLKEAHEKYHPREKDFK
jgi:integrase/recombinase XerD